MKKFLSIMLAAAMALSLTACNNSSASSESSGSSAAESPADSGAAASTAESQATAESGDGQLLSNPIALNSEGDIDMDTALAYETDYEAMKAYFESREVDPTKPVSENAQTNEKTMEVWNYLRSVYGKQVITCQQMMGNECYEDLVFYNATNDLTAMKGYDFIFCTGSYHSDDMIDEAIEWSKESGGLCAFTWHWNVPKDIDNPEGGYAFYTSEITNFSQVNAVTPGTKEYETVIHDIDLIATKIQRMESEGVTILFRPLHEASGAWFWWGLQGRDSATNEVFQKLWYMIYDRLENYHKLTNIIWVWNGQNPHTAIHPNAFDIEGIDRYYDQEDISAEALSTYYEKCYGELAGYDKYCAELAGMESTGKMMALTECGYIPDPEGIKAANTMWLYYMVWNGDFIYETDAAGKAMVDLNGTPHPNPKKGITNEMLAEYFSNDLYITHNKLPEFSFGVREIPQQIKNWEYFRIG
ncbi:MAG TPA: beta-mannanase [Ruminococcaceae bacterium]|jgi:mannan endo-1,4-beta-mannosidase|nr:beta-mannanase [Oscillospiraceae bacterium]